MQFTRDHRGFNIELAMNCKQRKVEEKLYDSTEGFHSALIKQCRNIAE